MINIKCGDKQLAVRSLVVPVTVKSAREGGVVDASGAPARLDGDAFSVSDIALAKELVVTTAGKGFIFERTEQGLLFVVALDEAHAWALIDQRHLELNPGDENEAPEHKQLRVQRYRRRHRLSQVVDIGALGVTPIET